MSEQAKGNITAWRSPGTASWANLDTEKQAVLIQKCNEWGVTTFNWCGIMMFRCPHCTLEFEDVGYVLAHTRDHGKGPIFVEEVDINGAADNRS